MSEDLEQVVANALQVASGYVGLGRCDEAGEVCEKILHLKPDCVDAHFRQSTSQHHVYPHRDAHTQLKPSGTRSAIFCQANPNFDGRSTENGRTPSHLHSSPLRSEQHSNHGQLRLP